MQEELPDFPQSNSERMVPETRKPVRPKSGAMNVALAIFLSVIFSTLISGTLIFSDTAKDKVLSVFGINPKQQPDPLLPLQHRIDRVVAEQQQIVDAFNEELLALKNAVSKSDASDETLTNRIIAIEKNVAAFRNETAKKWETQKQTLAAQKAKAIAAAKPKEPINPVSIVSIRGWGNAGFVTLKEGLDYSELLSVGDSWRGWHVLSVDANARKATFRIHDQVKELVM